MLLASNSVCTVVADCVLLASLHMCLYTHVWVQATGCNRVGSACSVCQGLQYLCCARWTPCILHLVSFALSCTALSHLNCRIGNSAHMPVLSGLEDVA